MKNNKRADTIAGIIIAVFILSFAMLGIVNVLDYNQSVSDNYEKETDLYILKSNSDNILKRLNIDGIQENEKFYVFKDQSTNEYKVLTGATNEKYKYVDKDGNNVDPTNAVGKTFTREFTKKIDILRYDIKPPEINNLVLHLDATNINGLNNSNSGMIDGQTISVWKNIAGGGRPDAVDKINLPTTANYTSLLPNYSIDGLNLKPMVEFNGEQMLGFSAHRDFNSDLLCNHPERYFTERSLAIVFKTSDDLTSKQIIYEEGGGAIGYNFSIEGGDVWSSVHNKAYNFGGVCSTNREINTRDSGHTFKSINLGEVRPNTIYFIMIVQDSSHFDNYGNPIDSQNRLKIYLNGVLANEIDHVDPMPEHMYGGLGNIYYGNVSGKTGDTLRDVGYPASSRSVKAYFKGGIGELISWNHALTENEIRGIQNYFSQKWLGGKRSIRYDIVETDIKEFKQY